MTKMICPTCGLLALSESVEQGSKELCPRCLAKSGGALSVVLLPVDSAQRKSREGRVLAGLRKRAGWALRA